MEKNTFKSVAEYQEWLKAKKPKPAPKKAAPKKVVAKETKK